MTDFCYMSIFFVSFISYLVFMIIIFIMSLLVDRFEKMIIPISLVGIIISLLMPFVHTFLVGITCG